MSKCQKNTMSIFSERLIRTKHRLISVVFVMCFVVLSKGNQNIATQQAQPVELAQLTAVAGGRTLLTCDVTPATANDTLLLVVWYKEDVPIYSYDTRGESLVAGTHWAESAVLGARASFQVSISPSSLILEDVRETDAGEYRCRVDFKVAPTRYFRINLNVVVLPDKPKIFDERGKEVSSRAGPYYEGGDLILTCMVSGGKPKPTISWYRGDELLESVEVSSGFPHTRSSQLKIRGLTRMDQHSRFTCRSANTVLAAPQTTIVDLEMYLKPVEVEILSREQPLSANQAAQFTCRAVGSRPPAKISWWMQGIRLGSQEQVDSDDGNVSSSTLSFTPMLEDNDKSLICRAENQKLDDSTADTSLILNVLFVPIVNLQLGPNLNPNDIEEGDDVYFECNVRANPPAYKVIWEHNGQPMQHNQRLGVIANSAHLALQGVTRATAGRYTCAASNVEGDGRSTPLTLNVMYKPVCRSDVMKVYGVARQEQVRVLCSVDSFPQPDTFSWSFNNTAHSFEVPEERFVSGEEAGGSGKSILTYTPISEMDYGTLLCWASNLAGKSETPCSFSLIPAGPPEMPYNCTVQNQTTESLEIVCQAGYDGGVQQTFALEAWEQRTGELLANVTTKKYPPLFMIGGLSSGQGLSIKVFSYNNKGRSEANLFEGFTLKMAEKQTGQHDSMEISSIFGILIGILLTLILISVIAVIAIKMREKMTDSYIIQSSKHHKSPTNNSIPHDTIVTTTDDKNPDVIPAGKCTGNKAVYIAVSGMERLPSKPPDPPPYSRVASTQLADNVDACSGSEGLDRTPTANATFPLTRAALTLHDAREANEIKDGQLARPIQRPGVMRCDPEGLETSLLPPGLRSAPPREIVTTRTPLLSSQQESCV